MDGAENMDQTEEHFSTFIACKKTERRGTKKRKNSIHSVVREKEKGMRDILGSMKFQQKTK